MSKTKHAKNAATIRVTYPDGCRQGWQTRLDAPLASNCRMFAKWLRVIADTIEETATTEGMCVRAPDDQDLPPADTGSPPRNTSTGNS